MNFLPPIFSIRARLTALFVLVFGISLIAMSALGYQHFAKTQQLDFDTALFNHVIDVASTVNVNFIGEITIPTLPEDAAGKVFPFSLRRSYIQIRDLSGRLIAVSDNLHESPLPLTHKDYEQMNANGVHFRTIPDPVSAHRTLQTSYRLISYLANKPPLPPFILQVAAPMTFLERARKDIRSFLFFAVPLVLIVATLGGLFFSYRALSPVAAITQKAENIQVGNLSERVPVPATSGDEVAELAETFNRLLERIERTVVSNQRFVADASHQLKTPLSILRGELDLMLRKQRSPEEIKNFLASASQEIDSLSSLVERLLTLARIEAGQEGLALAPVRIDEVALEVISQLAPLADAKEIKLKLNLHELNPVLQTEFRTLGDQELLRTMLFNLLENAVKYSDNSKPVEVSLFEQNDAIEVQIRDNGPGMPPTMLPRLFERFYRGATIPRSKTKGFGLGLSIAQSIAKAHHSLIQVQTEVGVGSVFSVSLKKS